MTNNAWRPTKNTEKEDRIIAKVCEQFFRWGYSKKDFYPIVAKAAKDIMNRRAEDDEESRALSVGSIKKIYADYKDTEKKLNQDLYGEEFNNFQRILYTKTQLSENAPKRICRKAVIIELIEFMNTNPERCIFRDNPECRDPENCWWQMFKGERDGDHILAPDQKKRLMKGNSIKLPQEKEGEGDRVPWYFTEQEYDVYKLNVKNALAISKEKKKEVK